MVPLTQKLELAIEGVAPPFQYPSSSNLMAFQSSGIIPTSVCLYPGFDLYFVLLLPYKSHLLQMCVNLAAALSSLLIGPLFWWLFHIRPHRFTLRRGILVGSGGSLVAHPLTWLLAMVVGSLSGINTLLGQPLRELVPAMKDPNLIGEVLVSLFLSIYSLILVGWITALVGGHSRRTPRQGTLGHL